MELKSIIGKGIEWIRHKRGIKKWNLSFRDKDNLCNIISCFFFFSNYSWFYSLFSWRGRFIFWFIPRCALLFRLLLLTAQMQWKRFNMFPLLVWCYSESVLELLGWPVGISYNSLIWRIFDRMGKAFSKRISIPQNLAAYTESFMTTKSGWDASVW